MASIAKEERGRIPPSAAWPGGGTWLKFLVRTRPATHVTVMGSKKEGYFIDLWTPGKEALRFGWNKSKEKSEKEAREFIKTTKPGELYHSAYEASMVFALHWKG